MTSELELEEEIPAVVKELQGVERNERVDDTMAAAFIRATSTSSAAIPPHDMLLVEVRH